MEKNIERIAKILKIKGISIRAFELSIGASNGAFGRAIKNKTDILSEWLSIIIEKYPEINPSWLLTGNGNMLKSNSSEITHNIDTRNTGIMADREEIIAAKNEMIKAKDETIEIQKELISTLKQRVKELERGPSYPVGIGVGLDSVLPVDATTQDTAQERAK